MAVSWGFLNSQGQKFGLPDNVGGDIQWKVGDDIPLSSAGALGAQLANLASSASKSTDLASKSSTFQFTPGQIGLAQSFRITFTLTLLGPSDPKPYTYTVSFDKSAKDNIPTDIVVTAPLSSSKNTRRPSIVVVDSSVYTIIRGNYKYAGCAQPVVQWLCVQYSSDTGVPVESACNWVDDNSVSTSYIPIIGRELRLAPQSFPAPPAYRTYTFSVNGVLGSGLDLQAASQNIMVVLDRTDFIGERSVDTTTNNKVLVTIYCIRPPADLAVKGPLSFDPMATDNNCAGCTTRWFYNGAEAIGNFDSFVTPKGIESASGLSTITQPMYAARVYSVQLATNTITCQVTKPGQSARTGEKQIVVKWLDQYVPSGFFAKWVRAAGQSGPQNRDEEDGLRVIAILDSDTASFAPLPAGYSSLVYTAVAITAQGVATPTTFTQSGVQVSSITIAAGKMVGSCALLAQNIPLNAVTINVTASLVPESSNLLTISSVVSVPIAQPPVFVAAGDLGVIYTNDGSSTPLTLTTTGTVQIGPAGQGSFVFSFSMSMFTTQYAADALEFRVLAQEMALMGGVLTPADVSSLPPINGGADGDFVGSADNQGVTMTVLCPMLSSPIFRFQLCARNKYIAQTCQVFALNIQTQVPDSDSLELRIQREVSPIGAVGLRVDLAKFITLTNLLGKYNLECLLKRTGKARARCVNIAKESAFTMGQLAYNLVGNLNVKFKTRFSVLGNSIFRVCRGGSIFLNTASIKRLRNALNLFTNFAITKNVFLGANTLQSILGANSWLMSAGAPIPPTDAAVIAAISQGTYRKLLDVSPDVAGVISDLDTAQTALAVGMSIGETRTSIREGTFMSTYRTDLQTLAAQTYNVGPTVADRWTLVFSNMFTTKYGNGVSPSTIIVDTRVRIYPKGLNPRAGTGTIQPLSKVFSIQMMSVSGALSLGPYLVQDVTITLPNIITSVDGLPVPEFNGSTDLIYPECYRWDSRVSNWVSAKVPNNRLQCQVDINEGVNDFALILPPPFAQSTLTCPAFVLPRQVFTCTLNPIKNGITRESQQATFATMASGFTVINAPTGNPSRVTFPIQLQAGALASTTSTVTVTTMTAYIVNMPKIIIVNEAPVSKSVLTCKRLIIQSGCPATPSLIAVNQTQCTTIEPMSIRCAIVVRDSANAVSYGCLSGSLCRGNTAGTFGVQVTSNGLDITNNVTYIYNGGNAPTSTSTVFTSITATTALNSDNGASELEFTIKAPFVTNSMQIKVNVLGTAFFVLTKFGGDAWPLAIRANAPDTTSTVTCAKFSSYPRIANGKIVFMPMSIGTKAAGAYQTTPTSLPLRWSTSLPASSDARSRPSPSTSPSRASFTTSNRWSRQTLSWPLVSTRPLMSPSAPFAAQMAAAGATAQASRLRTSCSARARRRRRTTSTSQRTPVRSRNPTCTHSTSTSTAFRPPRSPTSSMLTTPRCGPTSRPRSDASHRRV